MQPRKIQIHIHFIHIKKFTVLLYLPIIDNERYVSSLLDPNVNISISRISLLHIKCISPSSCKELGLSELERVSNSLLNRVKLNLIGRQRQIILQLVRQSYSNRCKLNEGKHIPSRQGHRGVVLPLR